MKSQIIAIFALFLLVSCSKENSELTEPEQSRAFPQKWQLVQISDVNFQEFSGAKMPYQEYYLLQSDGTFVKARDINGSVSRARGTYETIIIDEEKFLTFQFNLDEGIISNCAFEKEEWLVLDESNKLFNHLNPCDGPILKYSLSRN